MSLRVWLPLTSDLNNQGLSDYSISMFRGTETYNANGKLGKCFYANGVNTIKILNIIPDFYNYTAYSISAWFYIEARNTSHSGSAIISAGNWNSQVINLAVSDWSSDHYTLLRISGTSWGKTYSYNFNLNTWYHVVVSCDGSKTYAYVNGVLIGDTQPSFLPSSIEGNDIAIGGATYYAGMQFFGRINDVRIYDHCLSQKEIKELSKGLVCHYNLIGNRGLPNLAINSRALNISSAKTNLYVSKRGASTVNYRNDGFFEVHCTTSWQGLSCWSNQLNLSVGDKITFSFYIYTNGVSNSYSFYPMMYNSSGTRDTSTTLPISIDGSAYVSANSRTFGTTATTVPELHYVTVEWNSAVKTIIDNGGSIELSIQARGSNWSTGEVYLFKPKIERGEIPTIWQPNVNDSDYDILDYGSRLVYDSSGYNYHGTINTAMTVNGNTPRYSVSTSFNGTDNCITIPYNAMCPANIFTMNIWFYKDGLGSKSYETLVGGPSGFEMDTRAGSATTMSLYMASTRGGSLFSPLEFNKWNMITMVRDGTNEFYYVNGELKKTIEAKGMPTGEYHIGSWNSKTSQNYYGLMSDFRLYSTCLSAEDIKALYNTPVSVANNGSMLTQGEFVEV